MGFKTSKAIDDYLEKLSDDKRAALEKLRRAIQSAAPDAEECISYQLPAFRLGKMLVGFGATSKHCAFYLMSSTMVETFEGELSKYDTSKGTIRFLPDKPLPVALIKKLVKARIAENGKPSKQVPNASKKGIARTDAKLKHPPKSKVDLFRKVALSLPGALESEHMGHPDFRFAGKIFASLGAPTAEWGMVKLTPEQQAALVANDSNVFVPCTGKWGKSGYTNVCLTVAKSVQLKQVLEHAFENVSNVLSSRSKAVAKPRPEKKTNRTMVSKLKPELHDDSESVDRYLNSLNHPLKGLLENLRSVILSSDKRITEGIKWNSPSFYAFGWFATVNVRGEDNLLVVLHHGAKVRAENSLGSTINDRSNLLNWLGKDRATISIANELDLQKKKASIKSIIKQWVRFQSELNH